MMAIILRIGRHYRPKVNQLPKKPKFIKISLIFDLSRSFIETKYCDHCGRVPANYRIANGEPAQYAPWAVYIKVLDVRSFGVCTGVLVSYQWVIEIINLY